MKEILIWLCWALWKTVADRSNHTWLIIVLTLKWPFLPVFYERRQYGCFFGESKGIYSTVEQSFYLIVGEEEVKKVLFSPNCPVYHSSPLWYWDGENIKSVDVKGGNQSVWFRKAGQVILIPQLKQHWTTINKVTHRKSQAIEASFIDG